MPAENTPAANTQSPVLQMIRAKVKERLSESPAFNALSQEQRKAIAYDTVKALNYILSGEDGRTVPQEVTLAGNSAAFAPAPATAIRNLPPAAVQRITSATTPAPGGARPAPTQRPGGTQMPGFGDAAREGGDELANLVSDINFPQFVGGLIDGVFNSIVTSSIKQMEAYAEMVKNVAKSVDQYMKDNVSENNARDYLVDRYPDHLQLDISGEKPQVKPKEGYDETALPDFFTDLGLSAPVQQLDDDNVEEQLVPAARRRIAMDRQQLLATMVMMGVNRLVVTNGSIEASCLFELNTADVRKRTGMTTRDWERTNTTHGETGKEGSGEHSYEGDKYKSSGKNDWYTRSTSDSTATFKMHTVSSRTDENTINMHAQLTGKVKVNFKSDYFPMEKMVDALQVNNIREKTAAGIAPQPQQPMGPPPALPPAPPLPQMPGLPPPPPPPTTPAR